MLHVIRCKKNIKQCGLGYAYKVGDMETYSGKPTRDLQKANIYDDSTERESGIWDWESADEHFEKVYIRVSVVKKR